MGICSSRNKHDYKCEFEGLQNYNSIGCSFQGAIDDEPKLRPIDEIDILFKRENIEGIDWSKTKLVFDDHLSVVCEDKSKESVYLNLLYNKTKNELLR